MAETRTRKKRSGGRKGLLKKPAIGKGQGRGSGSGGKGSLREPVTNQERSKGSAKLPGTKLGQGRGGKGLLDEPVGEVEVPLDDEILQLGEEIRTLKEEARAGSVMAQLEIGKRLTRAHQSLKHGQWERFLEKEAGYKRMTAGRLRQLAKWGQQHRRALQRVKHLGLAKVYSLMAAPAEVLQQLLKRKWHMVPGEDQSRRLSQLSVAELDMVLKVLGGEQPDEEMSAQAKAQAALDDLLRDAKRVVRGTNKLLQQRDDLPDAAAAATKVAEVRKRLLSSLKKLDKAFDSVT